MGPNGSGKSTLLRALLGLEPAEGSLRWGEVELGERGVGPEQRPAAWAPQQAALLSGSLEENLALGGASVPEARAWLGELGEQLGDEALGEGGRGLSGGERAWVNLARAWATGLPLLLLDEPTASLDTEAERRLVEAVEGLRGQRTVVVVTHRPELWRPDQVLATERPR
ncbi:MAG: ATP-binding cassette domain-containing protein [Polyangiaceae bacterium]|nr:ATP-binding cassette domain-containing protein [Polyangiaceae bacterium]